MSASLVGSEMCIRDSRLSLQSCPGTSSGTSASFAAAATTGPLRPHSVSYTHLTLPTICSV
eukprot:2493376-Alexandrium_andersonii.AAC.1